MNAPFHSATPSTPTTSLAPSDAEIIEQLKQQLDVTSQRLQLSELRVQVLEDRLRLQRIAKYGTGSEKLTSQQLELLELSPESATWKSRQRVSARRCQQRQTERSGSILAAKRCLRIFREWSA